MALCRAVVNLGFNWLTLSAHQAAEYILLMIFGTHTFSSDQSAMEYIRSLSNTRDRQQPQLEVAETLRQRQEQVEERCEHWHDFFI